MHANAPRRRRNETSPLSLSHVYPLTVKPIYTTRRTWKILMLNQRYRVVVITS